MITIDKCEIMPGTGVAPSLYAIGWGLARLGRFGNQAETWYPVLPHVLTVAGLVPQEARIHALLHDAAEAIVGDQVATWKNGLTAESEDEILDNLYKSLALEQPSEEIAELVHIADIVARSAEAAVIGHAEPNHPHFLDVRIQYPQMYESALDQTRSRLAIYTAQRCLCETAAMATLFEDNVNEAMENITTDGTVTA